MKKEKQKSNVNMTFVGIFCVAVAVFFIAVAARSFDGVTAAFETILSMMAMSALVPTLALGALGSALAASEELNNKRFKQMILLLLLSIVLSVLAILLFIGATKMQYVAGVCTGI